MFRPFLSGAAFGAALTATAIHQPAAIVGQMNLQDWHMVTTFLTASGTSTIIVNVLQRLGYLHLNPRNYSTINVFGFLDGNIIGGCLLGAGLAVSGSCPGTVFAQVGAGIPSGLYALSGTIIGGIIWSCLLRPTIHSREKPNKRTEISRHRHLTLDEWIGTSQTKILVTLEILLTSVITIIVYLASPKSDGLAGPVTGGFLIAGAQLVSIVLRKTLLGTSSSFEEVGDYLWWIIGRGEKPKSYNTIVLAAGMVTGALVVSLVSPSTKAASEIEIKPTRAVLGGVLLAIGSRMGGGCTSGHGISGISLLSVSSFITVAAMFAGGMGVAMIMG
ncbi:uncharacterized protein F4822DRAFT_37343 [Hypoxylon trugodes]|uniref:uncharacterized protein n=1 Tax=Hypoxylon trugodes TaxID=326681 RepID=UPI00219D62AE|nr:uncharacterized protein F4822DRAFT_37343 [Hypoxylon trugodes]KAI1394122.1 hypothetical protein F4822DRAFT_37343 [Hypoxylon trugodes]